MSMIIDNKFAADYQVRAGIHFPVAFKGIILNIRLTVAILCHVRLIKPEIPWVHLGLYGASGLISGK